nr:hypothetical protein DO63_5628 [Burkholderia pseudomallei]
MATKHVRRTIRTPARLGGLGRASDRDGRDGA